MSKTGRINHRRGNRGVPKTTRHIRVRGVPREHADLRKLGRAMLAVAMAEIQSGGSGGSVDRGTPPPRPAAPTAEDGHGE